MIFKSSPPKQEEWEKEFDNSFLWNVAPIGLKKGTKEGEEYVEYILGNWIKDFSDDTTLRKIKDFIRSEKQKSYDEGYKKGYEDCLNAKLDFKKSKIMALKK